MICLAVTWTHVAPSFGKGGWGDLSVDLWIAPYGGAERWFVTHSKATGFAGGFFNLSVNPALGGSGGKRPDVVSPLTEKMVLEKICQFLCYRNRA